MWLYALFSYCNICVCFMYLPFVIEHITLIEHSDLNIYRSYRSLMFCSNCVATGRKCLCMWVDWKKNKCSRKPEVENSSTFFNVMCQAQHLWRRLTGSLHSCNAGWHPLLKYSCALAVNLPAVLLINLIHEREVSALDYLRKFLSFCESILL